MPTYDHGSRARLTAYDLPRFPTETLFHRIARVVCGAECLPRRELFESWEVARRTERRLSGRRVVDLACGHGLIGQIMLLLDPKLEAAIGVDRHLPPSAKTLAAAMRERWPQLDGRFDLVEQPLAQTTIQPDDIVVSCHACGALTDDVLGLAIAARASVAVLPCCQVEATGDAGGLEGWLDNAFAIDVTRAARLRGVGYRVFTQLLPPAITAKNRLLVGRCEAATPTATK